MTFSKPLFSPGDKAYVYSSYSDCIEEVIVKEPRNEGGYWVNHKYAVDKKGKHISSFIGGTSARIPGYKCNNIIYNMWHTAKEAFEALKDRDDIVYENYMEEIQTVEDLINFPMNHCIMGGEYTDRIAQKAYKDKAKQLLNVNI